jgi:hypothetical protein
LRAVAQIVAGELGLDTPTAAMDWASDQPWGTPGTASAAPPETLAAKAFKLNEQFRPKVPAGVGGWGAEGRLDTGRILALAR